MRQILTYILVLSMLLIPMKDLIVYTSFIFDRDAIAEQYCINTNRPELMCKGMCYLNDQLSQGDEHNQILQDQDRTSIILLKPELINWIVHGWTEQEEKSNFSISNNLYFLRYNALVFRPPIS